MFPECDQGFGATPKHCEGIDMSDLYLSVLEAHAQEVSCDVGMGWC